MAIVIFVYRRCKCVLTYLDPKMVSEKHTLVSLSSFFLLELNRKINVLCEICVCSCRFLYTLPVLFKYFMPVQKKNSTIDCMHLLTDSIKVYLLNLT